MTGAIHAGSIADMATADIVHELNIRAVDELVRAHAARTDDPLILAIRFREADLLDIHLLEILAGFPGGDEDELLTTDFERSAQLRILGKLYLTLCSPAQLRAASARGDAVVEEARRGVVVFDRSDPEAASLRALLRL